ncbi:MAG: TRAP transporter substrate-binding protein DctP [Clostridiales Family XIII bacterium]|nr:TRAP transporter substrate-binding protein DctP [Clostridiales Family XIII bacterium]
MRKKWFVILVSALLVISLSACTGSSSPPATDDGSEGADAPAAEGGADEKVYEIVLSYYASESIPPGQAVLEAIKYAEEKSEGRLKFESYFSGTFVSKEDTMASLKTGVIDMSPCEATQIASVAVLNQVFNALIQSEMPGDRKKVQEVYVRMLEEIPELQEEMTKNANVIWLYPYVLGGYNLHGMKSVKTIDDLKGLKVEAHGLLGQLTNQLGGTAVELDSGEYYNGMKLGNVDSQFCHWAIVNNFQLFEIQKSHTVFGSEPLSSGLSMPCMGYFINKDTWESLPEDIQQILKEAFITGANYVIDADTASYNEAIQKCEASGQEFLYIEGDDRKPWAEAMQPILDQWFADCEAAGYDGKAVYEKMLQYFGEVA